MGSPGGSHHLCHINQHPQGYEWLRITTSSVTTPPSHTQSLVTCLHLTCLAQNSSDAFCPCRPSPSRHYPSPVLEGYDELWLLHSHHQHHRDHRHSPYLVASFLASKTPSHAHHAATPWLQGHEPSSRSLPRSAQPRDRSCSSRTGRCSWRRLHNRSAIRQQRLRQDTNPRCACSGMRHTLGTCHDLPRTSGTPLH